MRLSFGNPAKAYKRLCLLHFVNAACDCDAAKVNGFTTGNHGGRRPDWGLFALGSG